MDKNKNNIGIFSGPIWEGTYYSFQDVPCTGDAFVEEDKWMESCQRQIQDIQASGCRYQEYLLPVIGAMVANENDKNNKNNLVVLDIGGGAGNGYPALKKVLKSFPMIFNVIENKSICKIGSEIFCGKEVNFFEKIPESLPKVDIAHFGSVIQYVDDWESFIKEVTKIHPKYILISDAFVGNIPTFITAQNFYGRKLAFRFLNIDELIECVENQGFKLILDTEYDRTMLGKRDPLPLGNFPENMQLKYSHHLLFAKNNVSQENY